jgi:hypothetical protein
VQPSGKSRLTAEGGDFAEELEESLLHQIFGIGGVTYHAKAKSIDPATMELIKMLEGRSVARLSTANSFRFGPRYRFGWSLTGQLSNGGATSITDAPNTSESCPWHCRRGAHYEAIEGESAL